MDEQEFKTRFVARIKGIVRNWEKDERAEPYFNDAAHASWEVYCDSLDNQDDSPEDYAESEVDCWE